MSEKMPDPNKKLVMDGGSPFASAFALVLAMMASSGAEAYKMEGDPKNPSLRELTKQGLMGNEITPQQYRQAVDHCQVNPTASGCSEVLRYEQSVNGGSGDLVHDEIQ